MTKSKSVIKAEAFLRYVKANSHQRFWQALRNWSGKAFIYVSDSPLVEELTGDVEDTFYLHD